MVDRDYVVATLADLVRINSVNPAFSGATTNETEIASYVSDSLSSLGLSVVTVEPKPGRPSVIGRLAGRRSGPSLMLYAHMDTVGTDGMEHPFSARVRQGRLFGRGAYDMKGGLAACIAAVKALRERDSKLDGDVLVVAVADEETESMGMKAVLAQVSADAAIVTEPTELEVCIAHKGFCWIDVVVTGRAAHGSRFDLGIDANMRMGRFLSELDVLERTLRESAGHPLVGPPSLHAAVLQGGTGPNTYAATSRLTIERRTVPGETQDEVLEEIDAIRRRLYAADSTFQASVDLVLARPPFEVSPQASIVRTVSEVAERVRGRRPQCVGQTPWMDAAFLADQGIETVIIGPSGAGAHAAEEWVDLDSVATLAEILVGTAISHCGAFREDD
ncbi:MAG: ArgE/DapE family deacylase [Gemmatimonadales bacterium]